MSATTALRPAPCSSSISAGMKSGGRLFSRACSSAVRTGVTVDTARRGTGRARAVDVDAQVRVALKDVGVDFFDAAPFAVFLECLANRLGDAPQHGIVGAKYFHFNGPISAGEVVELVFHDLDGFELELVF